MKSPNTRANCHGHQPPCNSTHQRQPAGTPGMVGPAMLQINSFKTTRAESRNTGAPSRWARPRHLRSGCYETSM
eukprot:11213101-Lingulodinium_polyedra.AAC.1